MSKQEELKEYVAGFVEGLVKRMRAAAHETVDLTFDADGGGESAPAPAKKQRKTLRSARAVRALPSPSSSGAVSVADVVGVVRANPGCNGGTLMRELGKPRHAILKPLAEAIATGKIRKNGSGRGLTYTAGR